MTNTGRKIIFNGSKILFGIIIIGFVILQMTCSDGNKRPDGNSFVIGFSQCTSGDEWRRAMHQEMKRELAFYPEVEFLIKDAQDDNERQIQHIQTFIKQKVDLLIVSPNEANPITPAVEQAIQNNIPVIIIDRRTTSDVYTSFVGADNYEIGKTAGEYVVELLKGGGKVLEITGLPGSSPAILRSKGFGDALAQHPNIEVVGKINGQWQENIVNQRLADTLLTFKAVDLVFAHNDVMARGAYNIFKNAHSIHQNKIKFIGVDGLAGENGGIEMVMDSVLDATFLYPTGGEDAIQIAMDILQRRAFKKENILQTTIIDERNVRVLKMQSEKISNQQQDIERQQSRIDEQIKIYKNQRNLISILVISLLAALVLGANALYNLQQKQIANKKLAAQNEEIVQQRNKIIEMAEAAKVANEAKLKFFTNISHEFRTPLTLILGPVEEILNSSIATKNKHLRRDLKLIRANAIRLLRLVTQLMDFRKIEHNKMRVRASEQNAIEFIQEIMSAFERTAKRESIDFRLITFEQELLVWFDVNMLDKVLFNLYSNAFKFIRKVDGKIYTTITKEEETVRISVEDNGRGMSPEHVKHAFDRFYRGEDYSTIGTGLGLSLSKELINLHKGEILLFSKKGVGTKFDIILPLGNAHFLPHERVAQADHVSSYEHYRIQVEADETADLLSTSPTTIKKDTTILLIEDNDELRTFLKNKFTEFYEVIEAADGEVGWQKSLEFVPDLIICDVMLPRKDGLTIVEQLKSDIKTSHIPIILLTAQDTIEQRLKGIGVGADDYISKPFHYALLAEKVKNILYNRQILRARFSNELPTKTSAKSASNDGMNSIDRQFVNEFISIVNTNIDNPNFNVNVICKQIGMSRVQLYRKVKSLLGYSVSDYIKTIRLKKAQQLLSETDLPISEIAFAVGFASAAYFSTAFKAKFKISPSEYKNGER